MELLGSGIPQLLVHSTADAFVPSELSVRYTRAARAEGDDVVLRELDCVSHFDVLDPAGLSWQTVEEHLPVLLDSRSATTHRGAPGTAPVR
jgi:pimeloyl-ACP methyl ester carboxylesterase